ncbi:unnamed protein product [Rotaria sp. Silwood1]|nr:unnamed protein product [Rotaria sp. Silwood1]
MVTRRESTILVTVNASDEDQRLPQLSYDPDQQQQHQNERIIPSTAEEVEQGAITSANENEKTAKSTTNEYIAESFLTDPLRCAAMPARYVVAIWAFFGFLCLYALRVNISVAIVAMVPPQSALNQSVRSCPVSNTSSPEPPSHYEFDWKPSTQGFVLGAFFYGYILTQVIGGNLAEKFGGKWIFSGCILIASILTLLTPLAARAHLGLLIAIRVLIGLFSGPAFPSAAALWGKWIPPSERSTIPPVSQSGTNFGIIFTTPLVSFMNNSSFLGGWPSAFYVFGNKTV